MNTNTPWYELVEQVRREGGIARIDLMFTDGDFICGFSPSEEMEVARGHSIHSMQEAVERCLENWRGNQ